MDPLGLPDDLVAFLNAGRPLEYDPATCEAGAVTLLPRSALTLRTFGAQCGGTPHRTDDPHAGSDVRLVPGVDPVGSCTGDCEPEGLLVWLTGERSFGVWDSSHDFLLTFGPSVAWSQIAAAPARHINAPWAFEDLDRAPAQLLAPRHEHPRESASAR